MARRGTFSIPKKSLAASIQVKRSSVIKRVWLSVPGQHRSFDEFDREFREKNGLSHQKDHKRENLTKQELGIESLVAEW